MHSQARAKRKFDASTDTSDGQLRIRRPTSELDLHRKALGSVPRTYDAINALALLASERHHDVVWCVFLWPWPAAASRPARPACPQLTTTTCCLQRSKHAHWAIQAEAANASGLQVITVEQSQQWETPWEVLEYVRTHWPIDFDACASPLNAVAPRYATADDSFLERTDVHGETIFCNPPYSMDRGSSSTDGPRCNAIGPFIRKLVDGDVGERDCTAIALLPVFSHHDWYHTHVVGAVGGGRLPHEVHLISPLLKWNNPFHGDRAPANAWAHPMMLCLWRPGAPPAAPTWVAASLVAPPRTHHSRCLHLRRCKKRNCGRIRVLPRHVDPASVPVRDFVCTQLGDVQHALCAAHEYIMHF